MIYRKKKTLNDILKAIEHADDIEINEILNAVTQRYSNVFPEWEVMFLSLPKKDLEERRKILELFVSFLRRHDKCYTSAT